MIKIVHRVNSIRSLFAVPPEYGVEVDIRGWQDRLVLNHEPFEPGDDFKEYLSNYRHAFIILNIKETGIETKVLELAKQYGIGPDQCFLLDVEFPYIYKASRRGVHNIAVRYSEDECIDTALLHKDRVDWVWIDVPTRLPLDEKVVEQLRSIKTCLVSPEQWGRPEDIEKYQEQMRALDFWPDAVMAEKDVIERWNV